MTGVEIFGLAVVLIAMVVTATAVWVRRRRRGGVLIATTVPTRSERSDHP